MELADVKHTIKLSTDVETGCAYCGKPQAGSDIDANINHLIEAHDGLLLHVGGETSRNSDGIIWNETVAVIGFQSGPAPKGAAAFSVDINLNK